MTFPDWPVLGLKLAQRAAEYGKKASSEAIASHKGTSADLLEYKKLTESSADVTEESPWWWVYVPLLKALLEKNKDGDSLATWATVGHYYWDHDKATPVRHWVTFLPEKNQIDKEKNQIDKKKFKNALENLKNAVTNETIMTSAQMLDEINQCEDKPTLYPLLICFDNPPKSNENDVPLMVADWKKFRDDIKDKENADIGHLSPLDNIKSPQDLFNHVNEKKKSKIKDQLRVFIGWLHTMQKSEKWERMLTIPAWLLDRDSCMHSGGIIVYVRSEKWLCSLNNDALISEIGSFTGAFRSGSMVLISEEAEEQRTLRLQMEKQAQMLELLTEPLNHLTDALLKTQEQTQKLRTVLYDPHRSLFAVASNVAEYFEEGRVCQFGRVSWTVEHKPSKYKSPFAACATIASIICVIFGKDGQLVDTPSALYKQMNGALADTDPAYEQLRKVLDVLLWKPCDHDEKKNDEKKTYQDLFRRILINEIRDEVSIADDKDNYLQIKTALGRFKNTLFTPFKDGDPKRPWLPLFLLLFDAAEDNQNDAKIVCILGTETNKVPSWENAVANSGTTAWNTNSPFSGLDLLVPRFSIILALISGVVAYARAETAVIKKVKITVAPNEKTNITCTFDKQIFKAMGTTFDAMKDGLKNKAWLQKGNFLKPFADFAVAASTSCTQSRKYEYTFAMQHGGDNCNTRTKITANEKTFSIETIKTKEKK